MFNIIKHSMLVSKQYSYYIANVLGVQNYLPKIIAITGAKRSGKDTLANYISARYDYEKIKLATPLKQSVCALFNFTEEQVENESKEFIDARWGITHRKAMQFFGTEMMQYKIQELLPDIERKFFVKSMINRMNPNKYYVISDMRFMHEYEEIAKLNPFIIRIDRPALDIPHDEHPSESEYTQIPFHLYLKNETDTYGLIQKFETAWM